MQADKSPEGDVFQQLDKYMEEFRNRTIYRELNPQVLATIPDENLQQAIKDFIGLKIDNDWEHEVEKVPQLGPGFSAVHFVSVAEIEVCTGGFLQLFWKHGRKAVELARTGADFMQLPHLSEVLEEALRIEEEAHDTMETFKQRGSMDAFMESNDHVSFEAADDNFFVVSPEIESDIVSFIRRNPHLFAGKVED